MTSASLFGEAIRSAVMWSSWRFSTGEYQKKSRLFCFTIAGLSSIFTGARSAFSLAMS